MRHATRLAAAFACALLACSGTAWASKLIEAQAVDGTYCAGNAVDCGDAVTFLRWFKGNTNIVFHVNEDAEADAGASPVTQAEIITAAQDAYQVWDDVPFAILKISYGGETTARIAADGINTTLFYNGALDAAACVGGFGVVGGILGITILTEDLPTGEIIDADIVLDSAETWELSTACVNRDVQSTITHEYGHTLGLHHPDAALCAGDLATRPTMCGYFCDPGLPGRRTLEGDDESGIQCLYPELPTVLLIDETGSMSAGSRMDDCKSTANDFVDAFADNILAVSAFAESAGCAPPRDGYDLLQTWTDVVADLHTAVDSTSACGNTPMWESMCCAVGEAAPNAPSNVLLITDTLENVSNDVCSADCPGGFCGAADWCGDAQDVIDTAVASLVTYYIIDMTSYTGVLAGQGTQQRETCNQQFPGPQSADLYRLAVETGGLYCSAFNRAELLQARKAIESHMLEHGIRQQNPVTCNPGLPIDAIQVYEPVTGNPASPFDGQTVQIVGTLTVRRNTYDVGTMYIEDCSGGIQVFSSTVPLAKVGDEVSVAGVVGTTFGEIRISPVNSFAVRGLGVLPRPGIVDPIDGQSLEMVGSLMKVQGFAGGPLVDFRFPLVSDPGALSPQSLTVFVDPDTGIGAASIQPGQYYVITGVLSRRLGVNELKPRSVADIQLAAVPGEARDLRASYNKATGMVDVTYTPACDATNHIIYFGPLANVKAYDYAGTVCAAGASGSASFNPGLGSSFFLIAGENGTEEGSYGLGKGLERPEDLGTPGCNRPRNLGGVLCE